MGIEVKDVPGRRIFGKGKQLRDTQRKMHVSEMEVKGGDYIGGIGTSI